MQGLTRHEIDSAFADRIRGLRLAAILLAGALGGGCASTGALPPAAEMEAARDHAAFVVREAQAESARLRHQVALARIEMAKQEVDLRGLRQQVGELQAGREELQRTADARLQELGTLRAERVELLRTRAELQVQVAELPALRQGMAELIAVQERLRAFEAALAALTREMAEVKKLLRPASSRKAATPKASSKARPKSRPSPKGQPQGAR